MKKTTQNAAEDGETITKLFPQKLMAMLADSSNHDAISWLPHGRSFIITDREKFSEVVLPKYFRKSKYASFTRKLNRWNFRRVTKGPDAGAYFHEFFQRGKESLCIQMYCKNDRFKFATSEEKKNSKTAKTSGETSPKESVTKNESMPTRMQMSDKGLNQLPMAALQHKLFTPAFDPSVQIRALLDARKQNQMQLARLLMANPTLMAQAQVMAQQQQQQSPMPSQPNISQKPLSKPALMNPQLQIQKQHQLSQEKQLLGLQMSLLKMKQKEQKQQEILKQANNMRASAA